MQQMLVGLGAKSVGPEDVFNVTTYSGTAPSSQDIDNGIDLSGEGGIIFAKRTDFGLDSLLFSTLLGTEKHLQTNSTSVLIENVSGTITSYNSNGFTLGSDSSNIINGSNHVAITIRQFEGFFDQLTYTGNGTARTISHSLNAVPEFMIVKQTGPFSESYRVYHKNPGATKRCKLNSREAFATESCWNDTTPTSSVFSVGTNDETNRNGQSYLIMLFASLTDFCKVGSYTGGGASNVNVDCSDVFSGSPRAVLIKNINRPSTDWHFYYTIASGNDSFYRVNEDATDSAADHIDPHSSGFTVVANSGQDTNQGADTYMYVAFK